MTRPFDGITVFTLGHAVAAHFASWQLAHLGPRVIEVYRSGVGDFARNYDDRVDRPWSLEDLRVEFFEITDKVPIMDVGLAWTSDNEQSKAVRGFIENMHMSMVSEQPYMTSQS